MNRAPYALLAALVASFGLASIAFSQAEPQPPPPSSSAQDPREQTPPTQQAPEVAGDPAATAATPAIEDKKIEQFADAYLAVQTIQQKAAADLQTATTPEQANKVKTTAESDMIAAVERSGLQVPEFNRIVETMAADVNVRSRVAAKLQERSGGT